MDLYYDILSHSLAEELRNHVLPKMLKNSDARVELICYQALKKIKEILEDNAYTDEDCFSKIEAVLLS